jgi:hypothetical protein
LPNNGAKAFLDLPHYLFAGFVVGGLHRFGPETEKFEMKEVKTLLQKTMVCK